MTDAKTYVDSRWGTRPRDERKRLADSYRAGFKNGRKPVPEARVAASREEETAVEYAGVTGSEGVTAARHSHEHRHVDAEGDYIWHSHSHVKGCGEDSDVLATSHFDERNHHDPAEHTGNERVSASGWIGEPYAGAPRPARPEPLREETGELERRLTGVENLAATAVLQRDRAIERAERDEAELDRLRAALEEALLWWRVNGLDGRTKCYCDSEWARENNPCGVCRYERCSTVLSLAEARQSTEALTTPSEGGA